ncbi:unnamed protein product [Cunninghamella echinulata]
MFKKLVAVCSMSNKRKKQCKIENKRQSKGATKEKRQASEYLVISPCKRCLVASIYNSSSSKAHSDSHSFKCDFHPVSLENLFKKYLENIHNIQ